MQGIAIGYTGGFPGRGRSLKPSKPRCVRYLLNFLPIQASRNDARAFNRQRLFRQALADGHYMILNFRGAFQDRSMPWHLQTYDEQSRKIHETVIQLP